MLVLGDANRTGFGVASFLFDRAPYKAAPSPLLPGAVLFYPLYNTTTTPEAGFATSIRRHPHSSQLQSNHLDHDPVDLQQHDACLKLPAVSWSSTKPASTTAT